MTDWPAMPAPDYESPDKSVRLYCADCLTILPQLPDGCVDAVVTDPPYGVGIAEWDVDMPPQVILDESIRISTGSVVWFGSASRVLDFAKYKPRPDRMLVWNPAFALGRCQSKGFVFSWHPIAVWRPRQCGEFSLDVLRHSADGRNWWNHPGTKPIALMVALCKMLSNATIIDPFLGSGTTGVACVKLGRRFIGIEIHEPYFNIAIRRIEKAIEDRGDLPAESAKVGQQIGMFAEHAP